jgi:hypothetical protein
MIVDEARTLIATHLKTVFTKARIGLGGNNTSPLSEDLDVPIFNVTTLYNSSSDANVIDFKFSVLGSDIAGHTIREIAIFNGQYINLAGNTILDYTTMLTRINFDGIGPFASGEEVDFYVTIEVE